MEKILQENPGHHGARLMKAFDLLWLGRTDEAKPLFLALAEEDPRNKDVQEGLEQIAKREPAQAKAPAPPETPPPPTAFELAEQKEAQGLFPEAIAHYRDHLRQFPEDDEARLRLGRVLGWADQFGEAEAILREWAVHHPERPEGFLYLGRVLSWKTDYEEGATQFRKGMALSKPDAALHAELARILSWMKNFPEALDEYQTALELEPDNTEARLGRVRVLIWSGELEEAESRLTVLSRDSSEDPQVRSLRLSLENLKVQSEATPSPVVSEQYLRALVEKDPRSHQARRTLADYLSNHGDLPGAIEQLRIAAIIKPEDDALRLRMVKVLSWNREFSESVQEYRRWLQERPDDQEVRMEMARVLSWKRDYGTSVAEYREVLKRDPKRMDARIEMTRVLSWARDYETSLQELDAVLQQSPNSVEALVGKGRIYSYQTRWGEALEVFDSALALNPEDRDAQIGKAQTLLWSGNTRAARKMLRQLNQEEPENATVLLAMASAENVSGRPGTALSLLEDAESLEPDNREIGILRQQIKSMMRPDLLIGWNYGRDTEGLNVWRYQIFDFRFNLVPRIRTFIALDEIPSSAPVRVFGYRVFAAPGAGPCSVAEVNGCTFFAPRVPLQPFVPSPTLLTVGDFPPELLESPSARVRQSALQFRVGGTMKMNEWFQWTAEVGAIQLRHGGADFSANGLPSTRTRFIYSFRPGFRINRAWLISLGFSRQYYAYTPKAISQTTHVREQSVGLTWTPDSRSRADFRFYHRTFSPEFLIPDVGKFSSRTFRKRGNEGTLTATRAFWKGDRAQLEAGYTAMLFGYTHPPGLTSPEFFVNTGVFAPSFYQRHAVLIRPTLKPSQFLTWHIHATLGIQQVRQGSGRSFSSTAGTRLDFLLTPKITLTLGYDYFNTASAAQFLALTSRAAGYHSNTVRASLRFRF